MDNLETVNQEHVKRINILEMDENQDSVTEDDTEEENEYDREEP